jgi:hypothetical protein
LLQQGIKPATDIFQQRMNALYHDMSNVDTFLDDSMILGYGTFTDHLSNLKEVLRRLSNAKMQVNIDKCKWFQDSVTYLGFVITRDGIHPNRDRL